MIDCEHDYDKDYDNEEEKQEDRKAEASRVLLRPRPLPDGWRGGVPPL
jgi:hypothetical protein